MGKAVRIEVGVYSEVMLPVSIVRDSIRTEPRSGCRDMALLREANIGLPQYDGFEQWETLDGSEILLKCSFDSPHQKEKIR